MYRQWGAFWNTPYVNQFPEVTEEDIRDRILGTEESTQAYDVTKDSICVHQPVNFEDSNGNIENRSISQQVCIM